ncbi:hypothetical protein AMS68_000361 [Peltaster fructicola]|uniref:SRP9 domain-containing protein n=1 Tax=Peltaster fructicola TaxID=286661 RepID=A0A6H0XJF3_9PEZI|nr:hypothetical protein AMS68_000361 [Peltaster fructicola]
MVYLSTLEEWQKQSMLLLQARPESARVTTKYNIPNLTSAKYQRKERGNKDETDKSGDTPRVPRATITLKTYDPVSGTTLKFKTDRAADVGRTIAGLGSLGRHMAGLPPKAEVKEAVDEPMESVNTTNTADNKPTAQPTSGGGASKKKKKGKK